jgi:hypothetical protein
MSWDNTSFKDAVSKTSFYDLLQKAQSTIEQSNKVLDGYVGGLGAELDLPERLELIMDKMRKEIEELHLLARGWERSEK